MLSPISSLITLAACVSFLACETSDAEPTLAPPPSKAVAPEPTTIGGAGNEDGDGHQIPALTDEELHRLLDALEQEIGKTSQAD